MIYRDDRTPEHMNTHKFVVMMTDSFMSGWGMAEGGVSFAGWAFPEGYQNACESWVRSRSEAKRVRIVGPGYRPKGCAHCHIYVWKPREV